MKLGVSQSPAQSDTGQQSHPSRARHLHHDGRVKESAFPLGLCTRSLGTWWPGPRRVLAPSRSGRGRGGGRVAAVVVERGGAGCVSCCVAVLRRVVHVPVVQIIDVGFLDKVVTCPLLRRQVRSGAVLGPG